MIVPNRFTDLSYCTIYVTSLIIECLITRGKSKLQALYKYCKSQNKEIIEEDVIEAISLLYLFGKVEYNENSDTIEITSGEKSA